MRTISQEKWSQLMEQGMQLLKEHEIQGAEQAFAAALALEEDVSARNNLASVVFFQGDAARAWSLLEASNRSIK